MNKSVITWLGVIGSIASIIGLAIFFIPSNDKEAATYSNNKLTALGNGNIIINGPANNINLSNTGISQTNNDKEEFEIKHLTTGISKSFVESKFGVPAIVEDYNKYKIKGLYYNFKKFYLSVLVDKNSKVIYYSITSKDRNFRPEIPYLQSKLGEKSFSELSNGTHLYSYKSSKYYEYAELINLGNPSSYRNIYLAFHSSGIDMSEKEHSYAVLDMDGSNKVAIFRQQAHPNTFGLGDIHSFENEEEVLKEIGVGIEYFAARDLP